MKRFTFGMIILILLLTTACSNDEKGDANITETDINEFESHLTDLLTDVSFLYEVEIENDDIHLMELTIDYYEKGAFKEEISYFRSSISEKDKKEPLRIFVARQQSEDETEQWISSIMSKNGYTSTVAGPFPVTEYASTAHNQTNLPLAINIGEEKIIGVFVRTNKNSSTSINEIKSKEDLKAATDYEEAYVIKLKIK